MFIAAAHIDLVYIGMAFIQICVALCTVFTIGTTVHFAFATLMRSKSHFPAIQRSIS